MNITLERVEELRAQLRFDEEYGAEKRAQMATDLLSILAEYAEKIRAGATERQCPTCEGNGKVPLGEHFVEPGEDAILSAAIAYRAAREGKDGR